MAFGAVLLAPAVLPVPDVAAQPVIQPLPDPAEADLREALRQLDRDPRSLSALIAAGEAALTLEDLGAAEGFFRRADAIDGSHGRIKAGLAAILVHRRRPVEALPLFDEAERLGAAMARYGGDRGLAYDLVGDNASAQQAYLLALSLGEDALIGRRLALSQAIAGDRAAAEATLLPMLHRQELAAFRARAFALAILGDTEEAVTIAETMLQPALASRIAPYLRYMPRLTRAQQAAAANLGQFPSGGRIGTDEPAIAALSAAAAAGSQVAEPLPAAPVDARLMPQGPPLGSEPVWPEPDTPTITPVPPPEPSPESSPESQQSAVDAPAPSSTSELAPPQPAAQSNLAALPSGKALNAVFADFTRPPELVTLPPQPAAGAVDITRIEPRPEAAPPPAPPPPPEPSRHWVQLAVGRDTSALAFDWRRIRRQAGSLLDDREPHLARWGRTNRLLAGPFADASSAQRLVTALRAQNVDSLRFTSAEGEVVRPLR